MTGSTLLALASLGLAPHVDAADSGFYVAGMYGQASYDESGEDADDVALSAFEMAGLAVLDATSDFDDTDSAFGGALGYRFGPYIAAEAAYVDLGELSYSASGEVTDGVFLYDASTGFTAGARGPALSVLGVLPVAELFELYGRAGVFFADMDIDVSASLDGFSETEGFSESSTDTFLGVGGALNLGESWGVRLEFQRFMDVGDEQETGETDVDLINLGVLFRF